MTTIADLKEEKRKGCGKELPFTHGIDEIIHWKCGEENPYNFKLCLSCQAQLKLLDEVEEMIKEKIKIIEECKELRKRQEQDYLNCNLIEQYESFKLQREDIEWCLNKLQSLLGDKGVGKCKHDWGNTLLMSDPPQRKCIKCGKTEYVK